MLRALLVPLALMLSCARMRAENPPDFTAPAASANSALHEVAPGIYVVGKLRLDQASHTVTFPGAVNMDKGPLEYLLVTPMGSMHESLLVSSEIQPRDLHLAMLLIGAKGSGNENPSAENTPTGQITRETLQHAPKLKGDLVSIRVEWTAPDGIVKNAAVEDWIYKTDAHKPAERGPWMYNGSMFGSTGKFLADLEGAFIALVTNPSALINNPRKGSDNDQIWEANTKGMPPAKTPVKITIQLVDPPEAGTSK